MDSIITIAVAVIFILSLVQQREPKLFAAIAFGSMLLAHEILGQSVQGELYYLSAAFVDLFTIFFIHELAQVCDLSVCLQKISFASIILNGIGFVLRILF